MNQYQAQYLDLLRHAVMGTLYVPEDQLEERLNGRNWPSVGHTMIGDARTKQLVEACASVIEEKIPGDFAETGVWRGGACILMAGVIDILRAKNRRVWAIDTFAGFSAPTHPEDVGNELWKMPEFAVSPEQVKDNVGRYGLGGYVHYLVADMGKVDALPHFDTLAVLRLDTDLYEPIYHTLDLLYSRVSPGGYVIVDDYYAILHVTRAVDHWREAHNVDVPLVRIDWNGCYWRKPA